MSHFLFIQLGQSLQVKELKIMPAGWKINKIHTIKITSKKKAKYLIQEKSAYNWGMRGILGSLGLAGAPGRNVCLKYSASE